MFYIGLGLKFIEAFGRMSLKGIYRSLKVEPKASPRSLFSFLGIGLWPKSEAKILFKGLAKDPFS
jgi:hypothetical protein